MSAYLNTHYSPEEQQTMYIESMVEEFAEKVSKHGFYSKKLTNQDEELLDILFEYIEDNFEKFHLEEDSYVV